MVQLSNVVLEGALLALDTALVVLLNRWVRRLNASAIEVKNAKMCEIGPELLKELQNSPNNTIAYACVQGEVTPVGRVLRGHHDDRLQGVIKTFSLVEHKSKRTQGFWTDVKSVLRDTIDQVPFYLQAIKDKFSSPDSEEVIVQVSDALNASYLQESLTTTYDRFDPYQASVLQRGIDRIFGEVSKGIHETEKMLLKNTMLLGIGELVLSGKKITLRAPSAGKSYILTTMSKGEVIRDLESNTFWVKILLFLCATFGAFLAVHLLSKLYGIFKQRIDDARAQAEMDQLRTLRRSEAGNDDSTDDTCVVCLTNRREVVLLNCGHICLCSECVLHLPMPRKCPICRERVARFIPTYRP